jgi:hypothetical protein
MLKRKSRTSQGPAECRLRLKCEGTRAETRFRLSAKRTSPFKSAGASVQSTTGSRVVRISGSNAGYTTFRGSVRVLATHSIRQFPLHFPYRASPCSITFQLESTPHSPTTAPYFMYWQGELSCESSLVFLYFFCISDQPTPSQRQVTVSDTYRLIFKDRETSLVTL